MSGAVQTVADQLAAARADLVSLEADTATLEKNLAAQNADLDQMRREARAGRAEFADVVQQQTRRDAASGLLQQHLEDVAACRQLVEELEGAAAEAVAVADVRRAWASMEQQQTEYAARAEQLEAQLLAGLDALLSLRTGYQAAQQTISLKTREAVARATGLTLQEVSDQLRSMGRPVPQMRSGDVREAALAFAELADPENAGDLVNIAYDVAGAGAFGPGSYRRNLKPTGYPLLARALEAHDGKTAAMRGQQ